MNKKIGFIFLYAFIVSICHSESQLIVYSVDPIMDIYTDKAVYFFDDSGLITEIQRYCRDIENWHNYLVEELQEIELNKLYKKEEIEIDGNHIFLSSHDYESGHEKQLIDFEVKEESVYVKYLNGSRKLIKLDPSNNTFAVYSVDDKNFTNPDFEVSRTDSAIKCTSNSHNYSYIFYFESNRNTKQMINMKDKDWENNLLLLENKTIVQYFYSPDYSNPVETVEICGKFNGTTNFSSAINTMIIKGSERSWLLPFVIMQENN